MNNLRADIAELFGELDGYGRYEKELAVVGEYSRKAEREYKRDWQRTRYRLDPVWRRSVREYRNAWRWAPGVKPLTYGPVAIRHGTTTAYCRGCRCRTCRDASASYQRVRRALVRSAA